MKQSPLLHQSTSKQPPNDIGAHSGRPDMAIASSSVFPLSPMEEGGVEQNSSSVSTVAIYNRNFGPNRAYGFTVDKQRAGLIQNPLTLEAMSQGYPTLILPIPPAVRLPMYQLLPPASSPIEITHPVKEIETTKSNLDVMIVTPGGPLAILARSKEQTKQVFVQKAALTPNGLCQDLTTADMIRAYLYQFAHPAICQNQMVLAQNQLDMNHLRQLIMENNQVVNQLYGNLNIDIPRIQESMNELHDYQQKLAKWTGVLESALQKYIPDAVVQIMRQLGLDTNWIASTTHHVSRSEEVLDAVVQEIDCISQSLSQLELETADSSTNDELVAQIADLEAQLIYLNDRVSTLENAQLTERMDAITQKQSEIQDHIQADREFNVEETGTIISWLDAIESKLGTTELLLVTVQNQSQINADIQRGHLNTQSNLLLQTDCTFQELRKEFDLQQRK